MGLWTLEYDGLEQTFADWGLAHEGAAGTFVNGGHGMDQFAITVPGAKVDDAPLFPFEAAVKVRRNRTLTGGVFSGGALEFQGKRFNIVLEGRPEFEGVIYVFVGPAYDLQATAYQQTTYNYTGDPDALSTNLVSDVVLFQKVTGPGTVILRDTGEQIGDILQHLLDVYSAQSMAAPYQIGTIEPAVPLPTYQAKDITCAEAIQICLRCSPNAVVQFDHTTSPPTCNVLLQGSLTPVSVAIGDGVKHEAMSLRPRSDLQVRGVCLYFRSSINDNGTTWVAMTKQKYPADGPESGLRVLVQTIDMQGWSRTTVTGRLQVLAVANNRAWWKVFVPELQSTRIRNFSVGSMTIKDENGDAVSLATYPNCLIDGSSIAPWMRLGGGAAVVGKQVTITADATYDQWDVEATGGDPEAATNGIKREVFPRKQLSARVTLTNGTTGNYSALGSFTEGEAVPAGMAQAIYEALSTLQYEGTVTLVENECASDIGIGNALNLTGGRAEWTTMNALVQSVRRAYGDGRTEITIGPAAHLSAADLTQLFLVNRLRRAWVNPASQATASNSAAGTVTMGEKSPKENTNVGLPERSLMTAAADAGSGKMKVVTKDAGNERIVIERVTTSTGARDTTHSYVVISAADLEALGLTNKEMKVRLLHFKDATDCSAKKMAVLGTAPETDA